MKTDNKNSAVGGSHADRLTMKPKNLPKDRDLRGAANALARSSANALKVAGKIHTPCYVVRNGEIVNLANLRNAVKQAG